MEIKRLPSWYKDPIKSNIRLLPCTNEMDYSEGKKAILDNMDRIDKAFHIRLKDFGKPPRMCSDLAVRNSLSRDDAAFINDFFFLLDGAIYLQDMPIEISSEDTLPALLKKYYDFLETEIPKICKAKTFEEAPEWYKERLRKRFPEEAF